MVKRSRSLRDICTLVVCEVISLTTTSDRPLMLASTNEYTPSKTMENDPEARPKAIPMVAMNRVTAIEVRNRPCSLVMSKKVDRVGLGISCAQE